MKNICDCRVVGFGAKPTGFVLEVKYDEGNEISFIIKERIRKEVEEHLEYEEKEYMNVDTSEGLEVLIRFAKRELERKRREETELFIHSSVIHEMCVRRKF